MVTIQFIPYARLSSLPSSARVELILKEAKTNKILLLEGRLLPEEEALLIKTTMEHIDRSFKGIEFAVVNPSDKVFGRFKGILAKWLLGNRAGMTIIGPATIIKEIKKDPEKIELFMKR